MSDQTDFIALYSELGIEPDCSLDGLRMAYRRRVADLHPDRAGESGEDTLKTLNLHYAAALEFHRHYGRLPGAPAAPARRARSIAEYRRAASVVVEPEMEDAQPRRSSRLIVYGILLLAALLVWWLSRTGGPSAGLSGGVAGNERGTARPAAMALRQGMEARDVVSMLGEPVSRELGGTHWLYGPSWVRFECSKVIDWYSSPLQPLRASRPRPGDEQAAVLARADARPCPPMAASAGQVW